jgi:hypothetical protein
MPRKLTTTEEIAKAWEKKRERDKKAQANWVAGHHEEHLARMKAQYQRKKEKKAEEKKEAKENEAMGMEDVNANVPKKRKLRKVEDITERIKAYKEANPSATQLQISVALSTSQSSVSRALKG